MILNHIHEFSVLEAGYQMAGQLPAVRSQYADDPDFAELIEFFVDAIPERREYLETEFSRGNLEQVRVTAHQLKGAGGGYGFDELSVLAADLEQACQSGNLAEISSSLNLLLAYLGRISV